MKKNSTITFLSALSCFLIFSFNSYGQTTNYRNFSKQINRLFKERITKSTPGAAVVITEKGKPIFKECYGLANVEHKIPITSTTVFNLASASKQFTAFAILLLEKGGKIHLNDDIRKYLPTLPDYGKTVTIRHLLNHTSGIWEYWTIMHTYAGYSRYDYFTLNEVMDLLKHQKKLLFEPGSQWSYCNTNYVLLAQIVTKVTGESFVSWTRKNIFEPLGMKYSFFHENSFQLIKDQAKTYRKNNDGSIIDGHSNRNNFAGQGYLYTNIDDMILWMDNFRIKKLGGDIVVDKMFQKGKLNDGSESFYGYGLGIFNLQGKKVVQHSGQTGGYKTFMLYCQENDVGLAILANERSFDAESMGNKIFDLYLGIEPKEKEETQTEKTSYFTIDSTRAEDYVGTYLVEETSSRLAFCYLGENKFYGIFEGLGQDFFYALSDTEFIIPNEDVNLVFIPDENNQINKAKLNLMGNMMLANRIDFERLPPSELSQDYVGPYYSDALGTVYEIVADDHQLIMCHRRYDDRKFQQVAVDEFASSYGIMRFQRDIRGHIKGFDILDEYFNYNPIHFQKIEE